MKQILPMAAVVLVGALLFGAITLYALEGNEVVVLRTRAPDGGVRETRTWVADDAGAVWIEAAVEERPFYQHILVHPEVELVRAGRTRRYRAAPVPNPHGHVHIRTMLAEKYGWADAWVGLLTDTSQSLAVKLEPLD